MSIAPTLRNSTHEVWITLLLLFCAGLFVVVRSTNPKKLPSLVSGFFRGNSIEEKTLTPDSIALFFIFICTVSLLAMQTLQFHSIKMRFKGLDEFAFLGALLLAYYLAKTIALFLCGAVFRVQTDVRGYINEIYASAHLASMALLPIAMVIYFVGNINENIVEKSMLALVIIFFLYRTVKMFILMTNRGLNMVYLFLYLCVLEIVPLVLLFEWSKNYNL